MCAPSVKAPRLQSTVESDVASDMTGRQEDLFSQCFTNDSTGIDTPTESQADEHTIIEAEHDVPVKKSLADSVVHSRKSNLILILCRYLATEENVVIYVGEEPDRKRFVLNKGLLFERIPLMEELFEYVKGENNTPVLDEGNLWDQEPIVFEVLVDWLYGATLSSLTFRKHKASGEETDLILCKLFELAHEFGAHELAQQALDFISSRIFVPTGGGMDVSITAGVLQYMYGHTLPTSALRGVALEALSNLYFNDGCGDLSRVKALIVGIEEAYLDLLCAVPKHIKQKECSHLLSCFYHTCRVRSSLL